MSFLQGISDFLMMLIGIIGNFIGGVLQLILTIPKALYFLTYGISMMPPVLVAFATAFITVSVVYLVVGR